MRVILAFQFVGSFITLFLCFTCSFECFDIITQENIANTDC